MDFFDLDNPVTAFSGGNLDRADALRGDEAWLKAALRQPDSRFLVVIGLELLMTIDGLAPLWLKAEALPETALLEPVLLGLDGGKPRFAVAVDADWPLPAAGKSMELRGIAMQSLEAAASELAQARGLFAWHQRHRFCAQCGAPTRMTRAGYQRLCTSARCRAEHFPRTDPAVIMLALVDDQCLLGRNARFPMPFYSTLAGFMEPGESIEDAVRREVAEEAGIRIGRVRYIASQPWPFPSSLMIGCFAQALDRDIVVDKTELVDARWWSRDEVLMAIAGGEDAPFLPPPPLSVARFLIEYWLKDQPRTRAIV